MIVDVGGNADTLVVGGGLDSLVLTNPDTTIGAPDTVYITSVDTIFPPPDSVLITIVDTVELTALDTVRTRIVDTIVVGNDTSFVVESVDTLVTTDTIVISTVDTVVTVDTVIVSDTVFLQGVLRASAEQRDLSDGLNLEIGQTARLTITAQDALGIPSVPQGITWLSGTPSIATVQSGLVTAVGPGFTHIFAIAQGLSVMVPTIVSEPQEQPPPPPPTINSGPGEPIYTAGEDTEHWYDGFEEFVSSADLLNYESQHLRRYIRNFATNTSNAQIVTSGAFQGSKAVRFWYSGSAGNQQDVLIEAAGIAPTNANPVIVTFHMRTQPGYDWINSTGNTHKLFNMNIGGGSTSSRILLQFGSEPLTPAMSAYGSLREERPNISIGNNNYNQNLNYNQIRINRGDTQRASNDGAWHRYTMRFTQSTNRPTSDTGNGRIEMWIDGIKVIEYYGDVSGRPETGLVNVPAGTRLIPNMHFPSQRNADTGGSDIWLEFDDIRVWEER